MFSFLLFSLLFNVSRFSILLLLIYRNKQKYITMSQTEATLTLAVTDLALIAQELICTKRSKENKRKAMVKLLQDKSGINNLLDIDTAPKQSETKLQPPFPEQVVRSNCGTSTKTVGFIGCGEIAWSYAHSIVYHNQAMRSRSLDYLEGSEHSPPQDKSQFSYNVVTLYDVDKAKAIKLSNWLHDNGCEEVIVCDALKEACFKNNNSVDVVLNLTPAQFHKETTLEAIKLGTNVWCEKPLAMNCSDALELISQAKRRGVLLGCAPMSFWGEAQQSVANYIPRIGPVKLAEAVIHVASGDHSFRYGGWKEHPRFGLGSLWDCGIYAVHLLVAFFGRVHTVTRIAGDDNGETNGETNEDLHVAKLEFEGGAIAILSCTQSLLSVNQNNSLTVYGEHGTIFLEEMWNFDSATTIYTQPGGRKAIPQTHIPTVKHAPHPHVCDWTRGCTVMLSSSKESAEAMTAHVLHTLRILESISTTTSSTNVPIDDGTFSTLPRVASNVPRSELAGMQVSRLVFGVLALNGLGKFEALHLLDCVWACGINAFDCAHVYGKAETMFGEWVRTRSVARETMFIIGKGGHPAKGQSRLDKLLEDASESLKRIGVGHFDVLLFHRDDESKTVEQIASYMKACFESEICHYWGVSNWGHTRLELLLENISPNLKSSFLVNSPQLSLLQPITPVYQGTTCWNVEMDRVHSKSGIACMSWAPLACGHLVTEIFDESHDVWGGDQNMKLRNNLHLLACKLSNSKQVPVFNRKVTPAQLAIAYALSKSDFIIFGTKTLSHLSEICAGSILTISETTTTRLEGGET
eukprot:m.347138 g.347138  ORF g.347138 m.347138 type:complete len:805 (+) comp31390_c0_seq1:85-2499(+)